MRLAGGWRGHTRSDTPKGRMAAAETLTPTGGPAFTSLEQRLSYNVRGQPRAVFTRLSMGGMGGDIADGELKSFEMPLIHGARLQLGRFDPGTDGLELTGKIVISKADRRGISRSHGWLECHEGRFLVVWPVAEKKGFPTWVNGEPIEGSTRLRIGDWVGFGADVSGRPIVEFDLQIVNASNESWSMTKVTTLCKPDLLAPVQEGEEDPSTSTSPDALRVVHKAMESDYALGSDQLPVSTSPSPDQSDVLEQAQQQLAEAVAALEAIELTKPSDSLEVAQLQLAEAQLALQEKVAAHQKERSLRTRLSLEVEELRAANDRHDD